MSEPDDRLPPEINEGEDEELSLTALSVIGDLKKIPLYRHPPGLNDKVMNRIKEKKQNESQE